MLVSAELYGRHFYAGSSAAFRVCIANDAEDCTALPASRLSWEISGNGKTLAQGNQPIPSIPYYTNCWVGVEARIPALLPAGRVNATLTLRLISNGVTFSENDYDITIAERSWAAVQGIGNSRRFALFDPEGQASGMLSKESFHRVTSLDALERGQSLIVTRAEATLEKI